MSSGTVSWEPGSPTDRRAQPVHTYGRLVVDDGRLVEHAVIPLA